MLKSQASRLSLFKGWFIHRYKVKFLSLIVILVVLFGCGRELSQQEYVRWVRSYDNGLHIQKEVGAFALDLQYQPSEYMKLINEKNGIRNGQSDSIQYYVLRIRLSRSNDDIINYQVQNNAEKQQRLYYFSYLFQNYIYIEDSGVRYPCTLFHFEQSDLEGARTFVLGFPQSKGEEPCLVVDSPLFGSLPVKVKIHRHDIPTVKLL